MDHLNHIPEAIFDLLQQKQYDALTAEEKRLVQSFFSPEEYDELYQAHVLGASFFRDGVAVLPSGEVENRLKGAFRDHFGKEKPMLAKTLQHPVALWKAAAVMVALLGIALLGIWKSGILSPQLVYKTIHDTITVAGDAAVIHDTVIVYREKPASSNPGKTNYSSFAVSDSNGTNPPSPVRNAAKRKGKSMREDSLTKRFVFVRI
jgi:hypothetical protein